MRSATVLRVGVLLLFSLSSLLLVSPTGAQVSCAFNPSFQGLHDLIPETVGDCIENEQLNPTTGNIEQHTSGGQLMLRPSDNLTGFMDGTTLWLIGPNGLVSRLLSDPQFPWEAMNAPGVATPTPSTAGNTAGSEPVPATPPVQAVEPARSFKVVCSYDNDPNKPSDHIVPESPIRCWTFWHGLIPGTDIVNVYTVINGERSSAAGPPRPAMSADGSSYFDVSLFRFNTDGIVKRVFEVNGQIVAEWTMRIGK